MRACAAGEAPAAEAADGGELGQALGERHQLQHPPKRPAGGVSGIRLGERGNEGKGTAGRERERGREGGREEGAGGMEGWGSGREERGRERERERGEGEVEGQEQRGGWKRVVGGWRGGKRDGWREGRGWWGDGGVGCW